MVLAALWNTLFSSHGCICFWEASFATLFLSYALLDMINFLFILPFEIQLHFTTIHQPLICPEQLTELHICSIYLFPPNESVSSEPASDWLIYNTSIVSELDIHNQTTLSQRNKAIPQKEAMPKTANWVPAPNSNINQVLGELALDSSENPNATLGRVNTFRCFLQVR